MNKWKKISFLCLVVILSLSVVVSLQLLNNPSNVETEEPEISEESEIPEPQIIEKPKFHIYDVECEFPASSNMRVSFKLQNLGNVTASKIIISYDIKFSPGDSVWFVQEEDVIIDGETMEHPDYEYPIVKFLWIRGNVTIGDMESKETNEYYVTDVWTSILIGLTGGQGGSSGMKNPDAVILESHWNLTCAEEVTETFEFF